MTNEIEQVRKKIGIKIKLERAKRSLSQEKLGELAGLSKTYINAVEHGSSSPTIDTLIRVAKAFKMKLVELVDVEKVDL